MKPLRTIAILLIIVSILGCSARRSLEEIRSGSFPRGPYDVGPHKLTVEAGQEAVIQATREALTRTNCALQEDTRISPTTHLLIGRTRMSLISLGVWCKITVEKTSDKQTSWQAHVLDTEDRNNYTAAPIVYDNLKKNFQSLIEAAP
jgi:hypothetical protein